MSGKHEVSFRVSKTDMGLILMIVERAVKALPDIKDRLSLQMDLCAAHGNNGNNPIDLARLLDADHFNFCHDVYGIIDHMDRVRGVLLGHFVPRFARQAA